MENKEIEIDILKLFKILWPKRLKLIKWGAIGFVIGLIIAFSIPKEYTTVVKITPEISAGNTNLGGMSALAGMAGINIGNTMVRDGITYAIYPDIIKSTPFLLELANIEVIDDKKKMTFFNYITEDQKQPWWGHIISAPFKLIGFTIKLFKEKVEKREGIDIFRPTLEQKRYIKTLRKKINVVANKKTRVLTIGVKMQNPLISAVIADSLTSKLQVYMTDYKTGKIRKNLLAKQKMLDEAQQNYYRAEEALAASIDLNINTKTKRGQVKINRLSNEQDLAFTVYKKLAAEVEIANIELQDAIPVATIIEPASVAITASSPRKLLISIVFALLGGATMAGIILWKQKIFS